LILFEFYNKHYKHSHT